MAPVSFIYLIVLFLFVSATPANAYFGTGTGMMVIQFIVAFLAVGAFSVRHWLGKVVGIVKFKFRELNERISKKSGGN